MARVGVDLVVNLGDCVSGPLDPVGTIERLMAWDIPTVMGNHDAWVIERAPKDMDRVDRFTASVLDARHKAWLKALPATIEVARGEVFLCHGTPTSHSAPWLDGWFRGRDTTLPSEAEVSEQVGALRNPVLLCGHTHVARTVRVNGGQMIVNPGSVGLQIYYGTPDARYAVLEKHDGRWSASLRAVPYDHEAAIAQAEANGFAHWREALRTGWAGAIGLF
jgi:diadenosine tetraphosphatase ApaH/serine/threonine PP2A family protein phosphatase